MQCGKFLRGGCAGLAISAIATCASAALAQPSHPSPAGDWQGVLRAEERQVRSAVHIEQTAPGVFAGDIDLPDSGQWNVPLEEITFQDGVLTFAYRGGSRRFEGRWDSAEGAWVGRFHNPSRTFDVAYAPGFLGLPVIGGIDGYWNGVASIEGYRRRFILHAATGEHGTHVLMDLPELVQTDLPVVPFERRGNDISFAVPALGLRFEGTLDPVARSIAGKLAAAGSEIPLEFRFDEKGGPQRPQTPRPPYPYAVEEVTVANVAPPGGALACTLTLPRGQGPHPAAILLTGSGQQDRDETLVGHKPFFILADHLTRRGVAVLRCDDRGVGGSRGEYRTATLEDFAGDGAAGIDFLRGRPEIAPDKIGLIGHSEGGVVAPMVANRRSDVAFVVLMAAPGVPIHDLLMMQGEEVARADGVPEQRIEQQRELRRAVLDAMRAATDPTAALEAVTDVLVSYGMPADAARAQAAREASPDILRIIDIDPARHLANLQVPVLAIVGSRDRQVPPAQNLPALRQALKTHRDSTILELPGLNHLFQSAATGAMAEYYDIEETIAPLALDAITTWLGKRGFGRAEASVQLRP